MCRVNVPPRAPRPREPEVDAYQQPAQMKEELPEVNFAGMFDDGDPMLGDLDLLELFRGGQAAAPPPSACPATQPLPVPQSVFGVPVGTMPQEAMYPSYEEQQLQTLQLKALLQQQLPPPPMLSEPQLDEQAQALLQQGQVFARMQAARGPGGGQKRNKSTQEKAEQEERIKRRRRESAARSRQRKSCYVRSLECENAALKAENTRLRGKLAQATGSAGEERTSRGNSSSAGLAAPATIDARMLLVDSSAGGHSASDLASPADLMPLANELCGM